MTGGDESTATVESGRRNDATGRAGLHSRAGGGAVCGGALRQRPDGDGTGPQATPARRGRSRCLPGWDQPRVEATAEAPLVGGEDAKGVRDYLFTEAAGTLGEHEGAFENLLRVTAGSIRVKTLDHDLDLVQVELLSGENTGRVIWVPAARLPKIEAGGDGGESEGSKP